MSRFISGQSISKSKALYTVAFCNLKYKQWTKYKKTVHLLVRQLESFKDKHEHNAQQKQIVLNLKELLKFLLQNNLITFKIHIVLWGITISRG